MRFGQTQIVEPSHSPIEMFTFTMPAVLNILVTMIFHAFPPGKAFAVYLSHRPR